LLGVWRECSLYAYAIGIKGLISDAAAILTVRSSLVLPAAGSAPVGASIGAEEAAWEEVG